MYTDEFITELINCPKRIIDGPRIGAPSRGSDKTVFTMKSVNGDYDFSGFISVNSHFQENFSVGLVYIPKLEKGKICLLRCNGFHGEIEGVPHHSGCHIHKVTAQLIADGIREAKSIALTDEYSTLETAIRFYLHYIGVHPQDISKHFPPPPNQIPLFTN